MIKQDTVFQRTQTGRDEIHNKLHGLTQSERRVLIMADGITQYAELCQKMSGLSEMRIEKAFHTLLQRGLVYEILMPLAEQEPDQLDVAVIDKFLRQESHDPITIITFDGEDDLELEAMFERTLPEVKEAIKRRQRSRNPMNSFSLSSALKEQEREARAEGKLKKAAFSNGKASKVPRASSYAIALNDPKVLHDLMGSGAHWGYWVLSAGACLISLSLLTKVLP